MAETARIDQLPAAAKADLTDTSIMEIAEGQSWQVSIAVLLQLLLERGALAAGAAGSLVITVGADDYTITAGTLNVPVGFKVAGIQVVSAQQPNVPAPVGGVVVDDEGRAAIAGILAVLEAHGLSEAP